MKKRIAVLFRNSNKSVKNYTEFGEILNEYEDAFKSKLPDRLPPKKNIDDRIKTLNGKKPSFQKPYQLFAAELIVAKENIEQNLKMVKFGLYKFHMDHHYVLLGRTMAVFVIW